VPFVVVPHSLSARVRALKAEAVHRAWDWVVNAGLVGPDDARGRRFHTMGKGSSIAFPPGVVYGEGAISIGAGTMIGAYVTLAVGMPGEPVNRSAPPVISIGERSSIGRGSSLVGRTGIHIGDDVTTAPNVYITDHNHTYDDIDVPIVRQWPADDPVRIGSGCWLGTGVVVLPGTKLGDHVAVAANSVVRGVVPDRSVIAGAPAKVVRQYVTGEGWQPPLGPRVVRAPEGWVAR
jgi:acetyltransferase-like isoleucine patch superfamily enzyme